MKITFLIVMIIMLMIFLLDRKPVKAQLKLTDRYAEINGSDIHYKMGGNGPYLMLLHGFTLTGEQWEPYVNELSNNYTLIIPDLPGHGFSEMPEGEYRWETAADYMLELLKQLNIRQIKGIGHSGGAITMLCMSVKNPDVFESLVLISGAHRFSEETKEILINDRFELADANFQQYYLKIHPGGREQLNAIFKAENEIAAKFPTTPGEGTLSKRNLKNISIPVLLISGDHDGLITLDVTIELFRFLPNSSLWIIPNQGHLSVWPDLGGSKSAAKQFIPMLNNFFSGIKTKENIAH